MSHDFDSGLHVPQRRKIRESIVAQLREDLDFASSPQSQGAQYMRAIVELAVPLQVGDGDVEDLFRETLAGRTPAIAVALGARNFSSTGTDNREWEGVLTIHVYVVSSRAGGHMQRIRGADFASDNDATVDPGLETAMEHVFERLSGFTPPGCHCAELRPRSEDFAYIADDFSIVDMTFETDVYTDINPTRRKSRLVESIQSTIKDSTAEPVAVLSLTTLEAP